MNNFRSYPKFFLFAFVLLLNQAPTYGAGPAATRPAPLLTITPEKASGVFHPGEKIVWDVKVAKEAVGTVTGATYVVRKGGLNILDKATLTFTNGAAVITSALNQPGTLLMEAAPILAGRPQTQKPVGVLGGAVVEPDKIATSAPAPDDFDNFWKAKLHELAAVPANPVLEKGDSGQSGVNFWKITLDNIRGTHIRGQLARPAQGNKFPALLIVQWAGVYPLQKSWVLNPASQGWLVLNIEAHDLPIDKPKEFYDEMAQRELKDYVAIGNDNRDTSYFLRMFLSCYRAADYLAQRPDWNGQVLVVTGESQGGLQAFVTAALYPKITAMMVRVPAGCDNTGMQAGRKPGWPNWMDHTVGKDPQKALETSRYYDGVNFAARVKCPALVGLGLIDTTARPEGVLAACNQLKGPKEVLILPLSDHHNDTNSAFYSTRLDAWKDALLHGNIVPPPRP